MHTASPTYTTFHFFLKSPQAETPTHRLIFGAGGRKLKKEKRGRGREERKKGEGKEEGGKEEEEETVEEEEVLLMIRLLC